jgi:cell cycle arrest protein BUB2
MTAATAARRSALSKRSLAADTMSLERLLREGPPNGDVEGALESTRLKILDQGIKSDSDGMVSSPGRVAQVLGCERSPMG